MRKTDVTLEDKNDLKKLYKALTAGKSALAKRKTDPRLAATTSIYDILDKLRTVKDRKDFERLAGRHEAFFQMVNDQDRVAGLAHLKSNPVLACIAGETGEVAVGDDVYSVFEQEQAQTLNRMMTTPDLEPDPAPGGSTGTSTGYVFTELPPEWMVESLPCGPWTVLPGYPTKFFDTSIGGRTVLVQLWKGSCPDYLGHGAGGVGAEVGLYNRDSWMPDTFWWPDHQHKKMIEFTLFNPKTNAQLFSARSSVPIWWSHKWMKFPSYDQYVKDQKGNVPASTAAYVLRYKIDGRSFSW